jgi:hypothetical protein
VTAGPPRSTRAGCTPRDNANQVAITQVRALAAAFTPTHQPHQRARLAGRGATAPSSTPTTRPAGRRRPQRTSATTATSAPSRWPHGRGCIPSSSCTRPAGPSDPTDRPRHPDPRAGQLHPGADASTEGALAVVARPRHARPGGAVAGLRAPLRPRAHHPLLQADPWLDHSKGAASRAGRAVDRARPGRLHPAPPPPSQPAAAMGTAAAQYPADAGSRPPRVFAIALHGGFAGQRAKPCGRSPGRPQGSRAGHAKRYPAIKKTWATTPTHQEHRRPPQPLSHAPHRVRSQAKIGRSVSRWPGSTLRPAASSS